MPHPSQRLLSALGAHPEIAGVSSLCSEAERICGTAAGNAAAGAGGACEACGFDPDLAFGETACPFSTLYWDFLLRHGDQIRGEPRLAGQLGVLAALSPGDRAMIRFRASTIRLNCGRRPSVTDIRPIA
ncbi:MAG: hypothetical protein ABSA05_07075 [Opitutaceae bacterium]